MRNTILALALLLGCASLSAQEKLPTSAKEDKEHIMSEAYWRLWNPKEQARIDRDIDRYRKADATIALPDAEPGTPVRVEQTAHDFVFGAHIFNFDQLGTPERNSRYRDLFGTLFNRATVGFYWKAFETEPGRKRFRQEYWDTEDYWNRQAEPNRQAHWRRPPTDPVVDFCLGRGVRVHGHPLIWGNRKWHHPRWILDQLADTTERRALQALVKEYGGLENYRDYDTFTPEYWQMTTDELAAKFPHFTQRLHDVFESRIRDIAAYYGGRISSWDVANESAIDFDKGRMVPGARLCRSVYGMMPGDYTYEAFRTASQAFPDSVLLNINDYRTDSAYSAQVADLLDRGARIGVVGSQMHLFKPQQSLDVAAGKEIQTPAQVRELFGRLGASGRPTCVSEITITSPTRDRRGEMIQAIIARNLYRLWFSLQPMMGITWWNVVDDCGAPGEPSVSGLFSRDMQPKQAYHALEGLINDEWKTRTTAKADREGRVSWRGFRGQYRLTYTDREGHVRSIDYRLR